MLNSKAETYWRNRDLTNDEVIRACDEGLIDPDRATGNDALVYAEKIFGALSVDRAWSRHQALQDWRQRVGREAHRDHAAAALWGLWVHAGELKENLDHLKIKVFPAWAPGVPGVLLKLVHHLRTKPTQGQTGIPKPTRMLREILDHPKWANAAEHESLPGVPDWVMLQWSLPDILCLPKLGMQGLATSLKPRQESVTFSQRLTWMQRALEQGWPRRTAEVVIPTACPTAFNDRSDSVGLGYENWNPSRALDEMKMLLKACDSADWHGVHPPLANLWRDVLRAHRPLEPRLQWMWENYVEVQKKVTDLIYGSSPPPASWQWATLPIPLEEGSNAFRKNRIEACSSKWLPLLKSMESELDSDEQQALRNVPTLASAWRAFGREEILTQASTHVEATSPRRRRFRS